MIFTSEAFTSEISVLLILTSVLVLSQVGHSSLLNGCYRGKGEY